MATVRARRTAIVVGLFALGAGLWVPASRAASNGEKPAIPEQAFAACSPWYLEEGDECVLPSDTKAKAKKELRGTCVELPDNRLYCKPDPGQ